MHEEKKLKIILGQGYETYMFSGQDTLQKFLVIVGVLMIPIMLLGKSFSRNFSKKLLLRYTLISRKNNFRQTILRKISEEKTRTTTSATPTK